MSHWKKNRTCNFSLISTLFLIDLFCISGGRAEAACECDGDGTCYDVTDDTSFDAVPWVELEAGDTVRIHHRPEPYRKIIGLRSVGTAEQPIKVCGVKGPNDQLPTISGENATPVDGYLYDWGSGPGANIGDYGNGIFLRGDDNGEESTITRYTLVEGNYVYHNGNVGLETEHNIYSQGVDPVFQYNRIGREREGAGGSSLKDRSSGTVIRYNWIESNARTLDLVEAEDASRVVDQPSYGNAYVYGNVLINEVDEDDNYASAGNMVHFGADNMADDATGACTAADPDVCRTGTLYFYHNTVIVKDYRDTAQGSDWVQDRIFELSVTGATADRNNIFYLYAPNGHPNLTLMARHGTANLNGTNWFSRGWVEHIFETDWTHWTGTVNYNGTMIEGENPGFVHIGDISGDLTADNYTLTDTSSALDRASALAPEVISAGYNLTEVYQRHQYSAPRTVNGSAMDLGAFEFGSGFGDETGSDNPGDGSGSNDTGNDAGADGTGDGGCFIYSIQG